MRPDEACGCDTNPATTSGPEEDCPVHGRPYSYWVEQVSVQYARVVRLRGALAAIRDGDGPEFVREFARDALTRGDDA